MNKQTIITALLALLSLGASAQLESVKELSMKSEYFDHERQVLIYTPGGYQQYDQTYYDVIYVFDAQDRTMFDLVHCLLNIACKPDPDGGRSMNFIIVGICSPSLWDINYFRNDDYLPMPLHGNNGLFKEGHHYGKSPDLKKFVKNELMPYIKQNYRTSGRTLGIGHSLSASFVLDCMITDDLFDDYIAVSPNCCYDEYRLATDIEGYQFRSHKTPRFIYASMAREIEKEPDYWGDEWKTGWERVSTFLKDKSHFNENTVTSVHTFPDYDHYGSFMPSLTAALNDYIMFGAKNLVGYFGEETCPVHIELRGKNLPNDIYITGNQDTLGNWEAKGIKMNLVSDSIAAIDLRLHLPAQFKFTRGSWEREAIIKNADAGNHIIHDAEHTTRIYRLWERGPWTGTEQATDTAIILKYGSMAIDTITVSKSPTTFLQLKEAESKVQGISDQKAKNHVILDYVLSHPDSDGSVYLLEHVRGMGNARTILSVISERARNGSMKKLYDAYDAGIKEFDAMTAKTAKAFPIGKIPEDFTLEDINGMQLSLSSLRGKYVLLDFWGSWCVNCIAAFPHMITFYEQHRDKLEILGVAIHDTKDKWKAAAKKNKLPWKLVIDTEGEGSVAERYGIVAAPTYVLIDPDGKVVEWTIGEHESIEEHF